MSTEPALMSLVSVAKAIASKEVSSREVTKSCLDRIAQWQPRLNAFMAIETDSALAAADAADAALAKGKSSGVLHGVPLAHKDMYYEAGKVVTCGSKIRRDFVATTTSTALQRLKDAGTVRLGSLQMVEFAYGPTVSSDCDSGIAPARLTRPTVVFSPVTPQKCAGIRIEPPVSDPSAAKVSRAATAEPEPDDEPPVM